MNDIFIKATEVQKSYHQGMSELVILNKVNLEVRQGEAVCIVGASGAGKSTLMHILGTLDRPSSGELEVFGQNTTLMSEAELAHFRNEEMGFVFQFHHLLTEFTALENVMIPCRIAGEDPVVAEQKALHLLERVGLKERATHYPTELSGGELQRVAIARALVREPKVLFADEPTGNLDSNNSQHIQELFFELKKEKGLTLIVVTHDQNFARKFSRVLQLKDGVWL